MSELRCTDAKSGSEKEVKNRKRGDACNNILTVKIYTWKMLPSKVMVTLWSRQEREEQGEDV
jgi:hypothetical protein